MSDRERDLARGMFGSAVPVRPAPRGIGPPHCLNGHDLSVAGCHGSYHHLFRLHEISCNVCFELDEQRSTWCLVDPAEQHTAADAPTTGLALVRIPPAERGGVGQLQLRIDGTVLADLDLAVCGPCQRAVLEHVRSDVPRQGYGRVLVAAALTLAPPSDYQWSTTRVAHDNLVARAFWAAVGWPGTLGTPNYCTDMERAARRLPDW